MATYPVGGKWTLRTMEVHPNWVTFVFLDAAQNKLGLDLNTDASLIEKYGWYDGVIRSPNGHTTISLSSSDKTPIASEFGVDKLAEQYKPVAMIMQSNTLGE